MLELSVYEGIPHLLTDVVTDMKDAANALRWCVGEMERRYKLMSARACVTAGYNERVDQAEAMGRPIPDPFWKPTDSMDITPPVLEKEPYIVVVDEFADLIATVGKKVEELIARTAQKARAAGIHGAGDPASVGGCDHGSYQGQHPDAYRLYRVEQNRLPHPSIGGPSPCWVWVTCYLAPNSSIPVRVHGAFVRDQEVHAVVKDWKARERPNIKRVFSAAAEDGEGGAGGGMDGDEELDPLFDGRWISWWINAAPPSPACSASSVSVITARRASSNRWKRRASSASRGTMATARCWRRLGTIDGRLAIAIQSERAA